jgi:hypothetical protein
MFSLESTDRYVYRYRSSDMAILELTTRKLRMSSLTRLNDPKEYAEWQFDLWTHGRELNKAMEHEIDQKASARAKDCAKALCATMDDESAVGPRGNINSIWGRGFCRPRMWQQYGENYQGACMIFDRVALNNEIHSSKPEGSSITFGPVHYTNPSRLKTLGLGHPFTIDYDRVIEVGLRRAVLEHASKHHQVLFFQKSCDWQSEKEYRWLVWDNVHSKHDFEFGDSLKGILVGSNIEQKKLDKLLNLCAVHKIIVHQLIWRNGSPSITAYGQSSEQPMTTKPALASIRRFWRKLRRLKK